MSVRLACFRQTAPCAHVYVCQIMRRSGGSVWVVHIVCMRIVEKLTAIW